MQLFTGKILLLILFFIAATVAVAVYFSILQSTEVNKSFLNISVSQNVLYHTQKLLSATKQNESAVQEYILTGNESVLNSLPEIYAAVKNEYEQLAVFTKSNPLQRKKMDSLSSYIQIGHLWSDSIVAMRRNQGQAEAARWITSDTVKNLLGKTNKLIAGIEMEGQKLLELRQENNAVAMAGFKKTWYIVIALLMVLIIMLTQKLRIDVLIGKKANAAMQYNALLMEHIKDAVISTDKNFAIVSWNRRAEKLSGWSEDEMRGKNLVKIVKPVYREEGTESVVVKELLKNESWEGETSFQKRNGEQATVLVSAAIIKDYNGRLKGIVAIIRDISAQKQLEAQLTKFNSELGKQVEDRTLEVKRVVDQLLGSEKKYKLLFEHNPLPMWMITMPDMNITDVNDAAVHHYGYARHEFLNLNLRDIHPQSDVNAFLRYMKEQSSGYHNAGVWRQYKKNRNIIFVEIYAYSMKLEGRDIRLVLSHDITQKIEAEKKLKQSLGQIRMLTGHLQEVREEERKNIARDIHDELGQQLTILKMDVAWIIKKLQNPDEILIAQLKGLLDTIDGTMKSVRRMCSELRPALLDDLGLIAAMEWQAREFEKNTGIIVELTLPAEALMLVPEIKTGLFRIFQESLTNVARHAQAREVKVNLQEEDKSLVLNIGDNGKGFDTSILNEKSTLGILGMEERSLMMGGKYVIESEPGKGTTVKVTVPVKRKNTII
jgi:two-component system sensor histidine kinase UhpB